jgi:membrane protease YdiL (CAAX protease family)
MRLSYFSAVLLTLFFLIMKILTEVGLTFFDRYILSPPGALFSDYFKLILSVSFILPFLPIFLWSFLKFRKDKPLLKLRQLPSEYYLLPLSLTAFLILALALPLSFQIFGNHMVWLSTFLFPCNDTYRSLAEFMNPTGSVWDMLGSYITIGLIGPVFEELFFRGIIFTGLLNHYGKKHIVPVILFQGLLFGLSHMNVWQIGYAAVLGFILGWIRLRSGSLTASSLVHIASNIMSVILLYHFPDFSMPDASDACDLVNPMPWYLLLLAGILMAGSLAIIHKKSIYKRDGRIP